MDYSKYILIFIWFIWDALFILVILINSAESFTYNLFSDFSATHPLYKSPIPLYSRSALLDWDQVTVAFQEEGLWFKLKSGSLQSLHVLPMHIHVFSGYSSFLPQFKNMLGQLVSLNDL